MTLRSSFVPLLLLFVAGCAPKLNDQRTLTLEVGEIVPIVLAPLGQDRVIRVTAKSPGAPISVYIHLNKDDAEVERKITLDKPSDLIIAQAVDSEDASLEAKIPANEEGVVRVQSASRETATVELSITS